MYTWIMDEFAAWLANQLEERSWTPNDFARKSKISPGQISRVLSGLYKPGFLFIERTAEAFHLPVEEVFKAAGLIPDENTKVDPRYLYVKQIEKVSGQLVRENDLKELLYLAELKLKNQEEEEGK